MEPVSLIIAALATDAATAAKDTAGTAIKDAYQGLKALIKKRFADKNKEDDSDIVDKLEKKPDSEGVKGLFKEELINIEADQDTDIKKAVEKIMKIMKKEDLQGAAAGKYNTQIAGDFKGIQGDISGGSINQTFN